MTETTQPDPQVVAWMREHRTGLGHLEHYAARVEAVQAYRRAHQDEALRLGLRALVDAYEAAARAPLTVPDIPAGQGPASLFLRPDPAHPGELDLMFKHADGRAVLVGVTVNQLSSAVIDALEDHLAATLPTVAADEATP